MAQEGKSGEGEVRAHKGVKMNTGAFRMFGIFASFAFALYMTGVLVCGCSLYMSNVDKDVDVPLDKMSGRYYLRQLNVKVCESSGTDDASAIEREKREERELEHSIEASIRAALTDAEQRPYFESLPFARGSDKRLMPVDIKVRVSKLNIKKGDDGCWACCLMDISNLMAGLSLCTWPGFSKRAEWDMSVTFSSDFPLHEPYGKSVRMVDVEGFSLVPTVVIGFLSFPDYSRFNGSGFEVSCEFRSEQAVRMVKSLCGELPDMYTEWLKRKPWYVEEQNQKTAEAAYASLPTDPEARQNASRR